MINVNDVYLDVLDRINDAENGYLTNDRFNRFAWVGQLNCIDWLSGDVSNVIPPIPYLSQKNRDYLSPFIKSVSLQVRDAKITKPEDYYAWENAFLLGGYNAHADCEEEVTDDGCNIPIELLSGDEFYYRCTTKIEGLQPSFTKPIWKEVGNGFEVLPKDLGSVTLEYIKYPVKSYRAVKKDEEFNDVVYDPTKSTDFEWPEFARPILVWFIADQFSNFTREQALKQFNAATGKTVRG